MIGGMQLINVGIPVEWHDYLKEQSELRGGVIYRGIVVAALRSLKSLPADQQDQFFRPEPPLGGIDATALGDADATDPRRESIRVSCRAARLVDKVDRALRNDNEIDAKELRELVDELKGITHGAERVAQASKRAARRKGRAVA